jgi:polyphosphate kinase
MKVPKPKFINRELSWLDFNQRVLNQAMNPAVPLLERVKFLAISASNLDEFFMVRVGGLKLVQQSRQEISEPSGRSVAQQLKEIRQLVLEMNRQQSACLLNHLEPELSQQGILRLTSEQLTEPEKARLLKRFRDETQSVISPVAIETEEDFPVLSGARLCLCVRLKHAPDRFLPNTQATRLSDAEELSSQDIFQLIPLGKKLDRFWPVRGERGSSDRDFRYMLLEDVIGMFLPELFVGHEIVEWAALRVTRNGDIALNEDGRADLMDGMRELLSARRTADCVRLTISSNASQQMQRFAQKFVGVSVEEIFPIDGPLALTDYFELANTPGFKELKDEPWPPHASPDFPPEENIFELIAQRDRLLHHPYQSYEPVVNFVRSAANDPQVIAIKQTLYRTSSDSEIVASLVQAAKSGKHVTAIVELKARFDEARNIQWASLLQEAGVDVVYGIRGLKTHAKCCIVVRKEPQGIRRYVHFGTGNYNEGTARVYSDISLFTCQEQIGNDAVRLFNAITGRSVPQPLSKLAAAPINLRETLLNLIEIERLNAANDGTARIVAKLNSLVDPEIIAALYRASQAGVQIRLNVRSTCCLIPQKKGLSENIEVVSVIDRFLEHSRIFQFHQAGDERVFISSADWMVRNLDKRIELLIPVEDPRCKARLMKILGFYFDDNSNAMALQSDGSYQPVKRKKKKGQFRSQQKLYEEARDYLISQQQPTLVFQPSRSVQ